MLRHVFLVLAVLTATALSVAPAHAGEETVPDVVGLNVDKARELMQEAGFQANVERVQGKPLGVVFSQEPSGLCTRDTAIPVTLRIGAPTPKPGDNSHGGGQRPPTGTSDAPPSGDLPPAGDLPPTGDLPPAGGANDPISSGGPPAGTTPTREPSTNWPSGPSTASGGGFAYKGQPILEEALPNTSGPALPGVLGQQAGPARRALSRYRVREEQTTAMPELVGQVLNQWPYAGSKLAPGQEVTIVVGVARAPSRNHRGVPQVQNRAWRDAAQMVERAGFKVHFTAVQSADSQRGKIVMQTPLPGSMLESGGTMQLRIGAGSGPYSPGSAGGTASANPGPTNPGPTVREPDRAPTSSGPEGPPAGTGRSPIDTPPAGPGRTPDRPVDTPPTRDPVPETPTREPETTSGHSYSAPAQRTPPAGESYPYKYGADFTWTAVAGASGYELELQEELPSGAWRTLSTFKSKEARFRPERFERGRYRWRVRATDGSSKGRWSAYRRLYMY